MHQRLIEIFKVQLPFAGKSVLVCGDFYQLPPVRASPVFHSCTGNFHALQYAVDLWRMFRIVKLTKIMRQQGDNEVITMLNKIRVGALDSSVGNLLQSSLSMKIMLTILTMSLTVLQKMLLQMSITRIC